MEVVEVPGSKPVGGGDSENDRLRVKRKTLEAVLQQCQRALELIGDTGFDADADGAVSDDGEEAPEGSSAPDKETDELCDLLKSRFECSDFLEKLESAQASVSQNLAEEGNSWDMISENDLWEGGSMELDQDDYVLVRQEDIVEGIACFMAAYLLSLKQTKISVSVPSFQDPPGILKAVSVNFFLQHFKYLIFGMDLLPFVLQDLTPNQLQDALSKTFSVKKKKGKLRKAWDGSKVIYNVASWGATAIGIYQNPALLRAASAAFWTSCNVISKLF
ncbi:hypothetical protein TEA_003247 [Camellia sinensis var. sinensis]|uniref:Uncharacterized protein n=1 Tax=Camellia sinensis var. sinensis TaxID=542762 RepID=A0A4S4E3G7_CAMSN|nr:hypothetical protein TEA_003247 [Camellia sinensis var. sinensis]